MATLLTARRLLTPTGLVKDGWLEVTGNQVSAWGVGQAPRTPDEVCDGTVSPGLVDVHSHGGGGARFGGIEQTNTVLATHRAHGTTSMWRHW